VQENQASDGAFRESLLRDASTRLFLKVFIGLALGASFIYGGVALVSGESLWRSSGALSALGFSLWAWLLYQRGLISGAAYALVWGIWLALMAQITLSNGMLSRSLMALPLLIIVGGWLLPPRGTMVLCAASLIAGGCIAFGESRGLVPLHRSPAPLILVWIAYSIYVSLAGVAAYQIFRGFRLRHQSLSRMSESLSARVAALATREAEMRLIMESVPVMLFRGDREGRCLYANQRYLAFYGRGRASLAGLTIREIVGEEVFQKHAVGAIVQRALAGEQFTYRATRPSPQGDERVLEVSMVPEPDERGQCQGFVALFRDITEEVRAEEKFAKVFRANPLAVAITRLADGLYLDVNEAFERQFGWRREEVVGRTSVAIGRWVTPEARGTWAIELKEAGRISNRELDLRTRSGEARHTLVSAELIEISGEECALVMAADITERKRAEERARSAFARFEAIFQHTPSVAIQGFTEDGTIVHWNQASADLYGIAAGEAIGRRIPELLLADDDAAGFYDTLREICAKRRATEPGEWPIRLRDGRRLWVYSSLFPVVENGAVVEIFCMDVDVTARRRAEEALRESSERFAKVFAASPVAISISRLSDGHYLEVNDAFVEQFGYDRADLIGHNSVEVGLWPSAAERDRWVEAIRREGKLKNYETRLRSKSGEEHTVLVAVEQIELGDEQCIVGLVHDITDRLRAEQEIRRLNASLERRVEERTAELTAANRELESFAYSISHDLRAPLRSIDGFSHLLAEEYAPVLDAAGRSHLERVRKAAQRMGTLIDDILELSRVTRQSMHRSTVDLSRLAREVMDELIHAWPDRKIELDLSDGLTAQGDPQLLRVLMQNLLENAWKYTGRQATARIRVGKETHGAEEVIFVADNGVGFDMAYADRLFVPFQRLHKPEDFEGTGIGLATVARIVHRHGGKVWAESAAGQGTTLRFTLPGRNLGREKDTDRGI